MSILPYTTPFVEDWLCHNTTLGEGAYGEVKLLIHRITGDKVACKIINHDKYKDAAAQILKEVAIHRILDHDHIIKYYGRRQEPGKEYIFLEYAAGGELFQLIEPDIGMPPKAAQNYMRQLLDGVSYLHKKGIAHRDIKPENLLIAADGLLKISDFGLATMFRYKGDERRMTTKCGTKPYIAPEVLGIYYRARPADIWSCGIVFVAMLTGELPWSRPSDGDEGYYLWKRGTYLSVTPWSKLGTIALSFAKRILDKDPVKRAIMEQVKGHPWMRLKFDHDESADNVDGNDNPTKRRNSVLEVEPNRETPQVTVSQPVMATRQTSVIQALAALRIHKNDQVSFSQPTHNDDLMIGSTQSPITKENFHNLVKRMTRFYVKTSVGQSLAMLCSALDGLRFTWNADPNGVITISTVDIFKNPLTFKAIIFEMDGNTLLDFRLYRGCGLDFKKKFLKIKEWMSDVIVDSNPE